MKTDSKSLVKDLPSIFTSDTLRFKRWQGLFSAIL